jgi:hypothetical protein
MDRAVGSQIGDEATCETTTTLPGGNLNPASLLLRSLLWLDLADLDGCGWMFADFNLVIDKKK